MASTDWVHVSNDWGSDGSQLSSNTRPTATSPMWPSDASQYDRRWSYSGDMNMAMESQDDYKNKDITKKHWVSDDNQPVCMNRQCRRKFSLIDRQHHCRKCGSIFCKECVKYQRKLNLMAKFDPEGKVYKVCETCFQEGEDNGIVTRQLTREFKAYKIQKHHHRTVEQHGSKGFITTWRDRLDLNKECERLRLGFKKSVGSSEVKRTIQEVRTVLKTPDWQKSSMWLQEKTADRCQVCAQGFSLMSKKLSCKVCGQALCKTCCNRELLLYIPDDVNDTSEPELAIIKIIGSPEVEPAVSLLLHVCDSCRQYLVDLQVSRSEKLSRSLSEVKDIEEGIVPNLLKIDQPVKMLQEKIISHLSKYQEIVESLEDGAKTSGDGSNTKRLAKAQEDLSDYFAAIILKVQSIKRVQTDTATDTQRKIFRNYLKAKSEFYLDNIYTFRCLKRKLADSAPAAVLECIQKIVDHNAIVSAQIYIRQLIFESIHMSGKYKLQDKVPDLLTTLDKTLEGEAHTCLLSAGEDWDQHQQYVHDLIKVQIKDHRLVRPSQRQLASKGTHHAADILLQRTCDILEQVSVQLNMKSINRSFPNTKTELEKTKVVALKLVVSDLLVK